MTDHQEAAARALRRHDAFAPSGAAGRFEVTRTAFDATVRIEGDREEGPVTYHVVVRVPTIDAVVVDETVADVVQTGWFETFERRLEDLGGALRVEPDPPAVELDETVGEVSVETRFRTDRPEHGATEAKSLVDYVEGTYVQGVIPGYEYREPVTGLIEAAQARAGAEDADGGIPPG